MPESGGATRPNNFELVSGDLAHPDMAQFIVAADGKESAYLQCYNLSAWNVGP